MKSLILLLVFTGELLAAETDLPIINCHIVTQLSGTPKGTLSMPTDVAIGKEGNVYVVDSGNHRIVVYSSSGRYLKSIGSEEHNQSPLKYPVGVSTSENGNILVADRGNQRIQVYSSDGELIQSIATKIGKTKFTPIDVAMDRAGKKIIVTASAPYHQVIVMDVNGKLIEKWGKAGNNEGEFRFPATIAVSRDEDEIFFVDVLNTRVQAFDMDGKFLVTVGTWGITPGKLFRPKGVALMKDNSVLVSDSYLGVVQLYESDTRFKAVLGIDGEIAHFNAPTGLAVDDEDRIYIVEMLANKVSICKLAQ